MDEGDAPKPTSFAALSHEFRTPLNAVLGMARLLEGTRLTAEQKTYVAALKQSGDHLLSLVNDVLDLAKLDAGALTLNLQPMHIEGLLQSVAELMAPRALDKGLELAWSTPPGLPPVLADGGRLRQVLFNLAGNAVKFTQVGGVILGCEVVKAHKGAVRLRLTVRDTGPGVPLQRQASIFQPFTHADERDARRHDSTGLGLTIVKRLAEAHGGVVGLTSEPGEGATFWFEADYDVAGKATRDLSLKGVSVIVMSPSAIVREAACRQIVAAGGKAIACLSRDEANARAPRAAVALVDHTPALERAGRVRPIAGVPCLVLLPPETKRRVTRSRAAGFAGYLIKPLRPRSLVEQILGALGRDPRLSPGPSDERSGDEVAKGARVLLVEDNPINALLARKLLEREGCEVEVVTNAEDSLLAAVATDYDLILMDRRLPGVDGLTAAQRLRGIGVAAPIVALTADAFEEDRRLCLEAGMDDFMTKPLDPNVLRGLLARAMSGGWTKPLEAAKLAS